MALSYSLRYKSTSMNSLKIHWQLSLTILIGWAFIGAAYAFNYSHYASHYVKIFSEPSPSFREMLVWELPYWFLWAMLSPLVFWLTRRFRLERGRLLRNSLVHVAACLALFGLEATLFHMSASDELPRRQTPTKAWSARPRGVASSV